MKNRLIVCGLAAGIFAASPAQAEVGLTGDLGTTGVGLHLSVPLNPGLNVRFGVNALNFSYSDKATDLDYDFKVKLKTAEALIDWFPGASQFRLSGGAFYNGSKVDARAKSNATGSFTFNGRTYTAADVGTIDGRIDFRKFAPYLGIGWGNPVAQYKGWGFSADLGVLFQGSPRSSLTSNGCTLPDCSQLAADVAAENRRLEDELDSFKAYPVIRLGVSYKF